MLNINNFIKHLYSAKFRDSENIFSESHMISYNDFLTNGIQHILNIVNKTFKFTINLADSKNKLHAEFAINDPILQRPYIIDNQKKRPLYPHECLQKDLTYASNINFNQSSVKIYIEYPDGKKKNHTESISSIPIQSGSIPCPLMSVNCNLYGLSKRELKSINEDPNELGSQMIITGQPYIINTQENKTENMIYKSINKAENTFEVWMQSSNIDKKFTYAYYNTVIIPRNTDDIYVKIHIRKSEKIRIPVVIFFKAIGVVNDNDIWKLLYSSNDCEVYKRFIKYAFMHSDVKKIKTSEDAIKYCMSVYKKASMYNNVDTKLVGKFMNRLLNDEFFPHIGNRTMIHVKILHLAYLVIMAIRVKMGIIKIDDKHDYGNKRLLTQGPLYGTLFRHIFTNILINAHIIPTLKSELSQFSFQKNYDMILHTVFESKNNILLSYISKQISMGKWPAGGSKAIQYRTKVGVSQLAEIRNPISRHMHPSKIVTQVKISSASGSSESSGRIGLDRRKLHSTQFGIIGPSDTPEGGKVGIVKYRTLLTYITMQSTSSIIYSFFDNLKTVQSIYDIKFIDTLSYFSIFINGYLSYITKIKNATNIYETLIDYKRHNKINIYTSIVIEREINEIRIYTDGGRILRPVYVVNNNKLAITEDIIENVKNKKSGYDWKFLVMNGYIEYISVHEAKYSLLIAIDINALNNRHNYENYTHCELHGSTILNGNELCFTHPDHTQSPRNTFLSSQHRQGMARAYKGGHHQRTDVQSYCLNTPQRPLVETIGQHIMKLIENPVYMNLKVLVSATGGETEEDAIIFDKASIDRGFASAITRHVYRDSIKDKNERYMKPSKLNTMYFNKNISYDAIDEKTGYPKVGSILHENDIMLGKVIEIKSNKKIMSQKRYMDKSIPYKNKTVGIVEQVISLPDTKTVKIKIMMFRELSTGDKMASFNAQKCIVNTRKNPEDMPYDKNGLRPDLIIGSTALITRLTKNQLIVALSGLLALQKMAYQDGSAFTGKKVNTIIDSLRSTGFEYMEDRTMYDGLTGRPIKCKLFMGPVQYMRLKRMIHDQVYSRSGGNIDLKTRQPVSGRPRGGGIRFEEMARDAIIAHGAAYNLHELLFDKTDPYARFLSNDTNHFCIGNPHKYIFKDGLDNINISKIRIPWIANYLYLILMAMGVDIKMSSENIQTIISKTRSSRPKLTKYEKTTIIAIRAMQLQRGATSYIKTSTSDLIDIARKELYAGKLGHFIIDRKMPHNKIERWALHELKIYDLS